jgi:mono/diheme cytochrome c family protein
MKAERMIRTIALLAASVAVVGEARAQGIIVDHTCTDLRRIPAAAVEQARRSLHIAYGHTSHGSQLVSGMTGLVGFMNRFADDAYPDNLFAFAAGGTGGALDLRDQPFSGASDLGNPDRTAWAAATRRYLAANPACNVIVWSWCGQVDGTEAQIQGYLDLMSGLERDFPAVRFVYMTGHLNGTGAAGNVNLRNEQIRAYCRANGKILYDFADIESYDPDGAVNYMEKLADDACAYDSDGNGSRERNWALDWQAGHTQNVDWYACSAAHSQALNGNRKAYAAWWLWARLAGWPGTSVDTTPPSVPAGLLATAPTATTVSLGWNPSSDDVGVAGYVVYRDGVAVAEPRGTAWEDSGLIAARTWRYAVAAVDAAGNESARSSEVAVAPPPVPIGPGGPLPATLAAAGIFVDLAALEPAAGFFPYEPSVPAWADFAAVRRWVRLPEGTAAGWSADGFWALPQGTMWVEHFELETVRGDPASRVRLETRVLVRTADGVFGVSFRWDEAAADAVLVNELGEERALAVCEGGACRTQTWRMPARAECVACHSAGVGFAPGFSTRQLNRPFTYPEGAAANQLTAMARAGLLDTDPGPPDALPALPRRTDAGAPLETRARAWLDVNCAACHQPGGASGAGFDVRFATALGATGLVGGAARDTLGDPATRLISPDHPEHSAVALRVAQRGTSRQMPPLWSTEVDPLGALLVREWVVRLAQPSGAEEGVLANLSTRGLAGSGDGVMIGGFVIAGSAPKQVLLRGVGPQLSGYGVRDPLADPGIVLFRGAEPIASNDDWGSSPNVAAIAELGARAGAFPLAVGSPDAALLATLEPGAYTAHVSGLSGGGSIGLFEVYEVGDTTGSRLVNLSTRVRLGTGERVAIPGLVVQGQTRRTFLVRAVGPGLAAYGLAGGLADPKLTVMDGGLSAAANDDWGTGGDGGMVARAAAETGAFALEAGSRDAALVVSLDPGIYTVVTEGSDAAEGLVLVEVYEVL